MFMFTLNVREKKINMQCDLLQIYASVHLHFHVHISLLNLVYDDCLMGDNESLYFIIIGIKMNNYIVNK